MKTIKYLIKASQDLTPQLIIAYISDFPFHSFIELDEGIEAYISGADHDDNRKDEIQKSLDELKLDFVLEEIPFENWNKKWEEHFEPVLIDDFCYIRADFHPHSEGSQHELIIHPKMAFGTGHHETTRLVISLMRKLDFHSKNVLDYGTGTGILAILAEKLGADKILAIDNDPLATENTRENIQTNQSNHIEVKTCHIQDIEEYETFDIIIANINLNVLTNCVDLIRNRIRQNGFLILSGVMLMHKELLFNTYQHAGFELMDFQESGEWLGALLVYKGSK
jgi:ribosomal protein L11 methyltransferase